MNATTDTFTFDLPTGWTAQRAASEFEQVLSMGFGLPSTRNGLVVTVCHHGEQAVIGRVTFSGKQGVAEGAEVIAAVREGLGL